MESIEVAEDRLRRVLNQVGAKTPYIEVMAGTSEGMGLRHDRQATSLRYLPESTGAIFRAWDGASWVEAASTRVDDPALADVEQALDRALRTRRGPGAPPGVASTARATSRTEAKHRLAEWTADDRIARAKEIFGWATSVPGIENAVVAINDVREERLFLNSTGARCYQRVDRLGSIVFPLAIEGGKVEYDYTASGGTGGVEILDAYTEDRIQAVARESKALLTAKAGPTGPMTVLLDPGTAGTFAHESFGHGTEADQFLRDRSYLKPILGQTVGPESLTLVDDGSRPGDYGSIPFDDEGFPSHRTVLVDHGRFVEVLHDRVSAAAMHRRPTGNCRRSDFLSRPFVRMTNTLVEPSTWTLDELLKEAKNGVVLESCTSGIEDPLGGQMQIKVKKGHLIEHGERTSIVPSMALSGRVLDVLRSIRGIGRAEQFEMSPGTCGKGHTDPVPVASGGPYLLTEAIVGPA